MTRAKVCCFTGHRPEALFSNCEEREIYELIYAAVEDADTRQLGLEARELLRVW